MHLNNDKCVALKGMLKEEGNRVKRLEEEKEEFKRRWIAWQSYADERDWIFEQINLKAQAMLGKPFSVKEAHEVFKEIEELSHCNDAILEDDD